MEEPRAPRQRRPHRRPRRHARHLVLGAGLAEFACRTAQKEPRPVRCPRSRGDPLGRARRLGAAAAIEEPTRSRRCSSPAEHPSAPEEDALQGAEDRPTAETLWKAHEDLPAQGFAAASAEGRTVDVVVWAETMVPTMAIPPAGDRSAAPRISGATPVARTTTRGDAAVLAAALRCALVRGRRERRSRVAVRVLPLEQTPSPSFPDRCWQSGRRYRAGPVSRWPWAPPERRPIVPDRTSCLAPVPLCDSTSPFPPWSGEWARGRSGRSRRCSASSGDPARTGDRKGRPPAPEQRDEPRLAIPPLGKKRRLVASFLLTSPHDAPSIPTLTRSWPTLLA